MINKYINIYLYLKTQKKTKTNIEYKYIKENLYKYL